MKAKKSYRVLTLVLAVLLGVAMTPCVLHAQSQSTTTSTQSTKAAKKKAKKEAKKARAEQEKANKATASATESSSKADKRKAAREAKKAQAEQEKASKAAAENTRASAAPATPPSAGMVWVNTDTKVYHKAGSRWYGKTKQGKWMTEAEAQRAGYKLGKQ